MIKNLFKTKSTPNLDVSDWAYLIGGLLLFVAITMYTITKSSIWFDEAFGAYLIKFNFVDIARYTATDVHPPLYYWLLKLWSMLFGSSELALRSMSVFFGVIAITIGYILTKKLFNKNAARVSLIFIVLSPMLVRYGQEARMYTLIVTIALAATYVLTWAMESKRKLPWIIYGILISLGMWTHYFIAIIWIAHWIWRADVVRRVAKKGKFINEFFSKDWILAHTVAIGLFIPWLPFFLIQSTIVQVGGFWIPPATPGTPVNFLTNLVYYRDLGDTTGWLALGIIAAAVFLGILAFKVYQSLGKTDRQSYRLILTLSFVPMFILFIASMPPLRSVFVDRYLMTSAVGVALFIGVTLTLGREYVQKNWQILITALIAAMMIAGILNVYSLGNYNKNTADTNQTRQIVEVAVEKSSDGQPIIAATPYIFYEMVFYSTANHPVYFIEPGNYLYGSLDMLKYSDNHKIKDISTFAKRHPVIWYIGWVGGGDLKAPDSDWKQLQQVTINDHVSGKPEYKAIQYKILN